VRACVRACVRTCSVRGVMHVCVRVVSDVWIKTF